jgi:NADPH-dependent glutamate synthase beta subunit-like oxidoreductase
MQLPKPTEPMHVIGICGGAVAGSEAAAVVAERGALAIVFEQNPRPYGKIEDGLPRWHVKLRKQEYDKIDENLNRPGVLYVPCTRLGKDMSFAEMSGDIGLSALVLAHGAWRDRALPVPEIDRYVGKGLLYQNPFVYWFNHYPEKGYDGPRYEVPDGTIVVGGGLASVDVVKIIMLELYGRALRERGVDVDMVEMEVKGIPRICEHHGIDPKSLGIEGCTLYYRRRMKDMPLADADNPTPEQVKKLEIAREKIMDKLMRKYLVKFQALSAPVRPIIEGDRMVGVVFQKNEMVDGKLVPQPGTELEVRAPLIISSIGSIPMPIEGIPMKGELYLWRDWDTGELADRVYGLGNVLTGKGNIKDSRENARKIAAQVVTRLLEASPKVPPDAIAKILGRVESRWNEVGYDGRYPEWIKKVTPPDLA